MAVRVAAVDRTAAHPSGRHETSALHELAEEGELGPRDETGQEPRGVRIGPHVADRGPGVAGRAGDAMRDRH